MHALENFAITEHLLEKQTLSRGVSSGVEWASQASLGFIITVYKNAYKCPWNLECYEHALNPTESIG